VVSAMFGNMLQKIDAIAVFPSYCCCSCTQYLLLQAGEKCWESVKWYKIFA